MSKSKPDFEKSLQELEQLVEQMESGELSLDDSLKHFQRGVELTRRCQELLEKAQQTVEMLTKVDDESSAVAFDPEAE